MPKTRVVIATLILSTSFCSARAEEPRPIVNSSSRETHIAQYYVGVEGALHVVLNDGKDVQVPKEKGRYAYGEPLEQVGFENLQLAESNHRLGWLASYMVCAQSYPCTPELVIFAAEQHLTYFPAPNGVIWKWKFIGDGKQVAIHYGFPHGDADGAYALYDAASGDKQGDLDGAQMEIPKWVQELRSSDRSSAPNQSLQRPGHMAPGR